MAKGGSDCEHVQYCAHKSDYSVKYGMLEWLFYIVPILIIETADLNLTGRDGLICIFMIMLQVACKSIGWKPATKKQAAAKSITMFYSLLLAVVAFIGLIHDWKIVEYNGYWEFIIPYFTRQITFSVELGFWVVAVLLFSTVAYNCLHPKLISSSKKKRQVNAINSGKGVSQ